MIVSKGINKTHSQECRQSPRTASPSLSLDLLSDFLQQFPLYSLLLSDPLLPLCILLSHLVSVHCWLLCCSVGCLLLCWRCWVPLLIRRPLHNIEGKFQVLKKNSRDLSFWIFFLFGKFNSMFFIKISKVIEYQHINIKFLYTFLLSPAFGKINS